MDDEDNIADLVRKARKIKGLTQVQFAAELGRAQSVVSKYERGDVEPPGCVIIHCMNIVRPPPVSRSLPSASTADVAQLVKSRLAATEYDELRSALALLIESVPELTGKRFGASEV